MTDKRFTIDKDGRTILDDFDNSFCECVDSYEAKEYCNKMNTLYEENQRLKIEKSELIEELDRIDEGWELI